MDDVIPWPYFLFTLSFCYLWVFEYDDGCWVWDRRVRTFNALRACLRSSSQDDDSQMDFGVLYAKGLGPMPRMQFSLSTTAGRRTRAFLSSARVGEQAFLSRLFTVYLGTTRALSSANPGRSLTPEPRMTQPSPMAKLFLGRTLCMHPWQGSRD